MSARKLTIEDIIHDFQDKVFKQSYSVKESIDGIKVIDKNIFSTQDGMFEELARLGDDGNFLDIPGFKPLQVNRSEMLPGSIKAWHLHYNQEDIWYVPPHQYLLLGLWDLRKDSPTSGKTQKLPWALVNLGLYTFHEVLHMEVLIFLINQPRFFIL
ncbi:MAG: hypothetical protein UZ22_OP11002000623 [Microgenomates bacterium OLB23]|nr:MAG: hypothetical protein UZ22_OP11002000623 [Microgenomates bacterium OLB23]